MKIYSMKIITIIIIATFFISGCSLLSLPKGFISKKTEFETVSTIKKVEFGSREKDLNKEFEELFNRFEEARTFCETNIRIPNPIILNKNFKKPDKPSKNNVIVYSMEDQKKIDLKILELRECIEKLNIVEDKYNLLLEYLDIYKESVNLDSELKEKILEIQNQRVKFYNEQINQYENEIERIQKSHFWSTLFERILTISVVIAATAIAF